VRSSADWQPLQHHPFAQRAPKSSSPFIARAVMAAMILQGLAGSA
jgi:hypothetical protein